MKRLILVVAAAAVVVLVPVTAAIAHPLGNFTINVYAGLRVQPERTFVDYVVDMAEIPAFQARQDIDTNGDGSIEAAEAAAYSAAECSRLGRAIHVSGDGSGALALGSPALAFPPGAGGLSTLRLECPFEAALKAGPLRFMDGNFEGRIGWHEVTAIGDGATLTSTDVPATSLSARLTAYPKDLLQSPLEVRSATLVSHPGGPRAVRDTDGAARRPQTRGIDAATRAFTSLIARARFGVGFAVLALGAAIVLGALHAFAPGHGKTVMAAYLIGQRGTVRQAGVIAATITATHTAGVLTLGVILSGVSSIAPEKLYPWLGALSGLMLCAIGAGLLRRALVKRHHGHTHDDAVPSTRGLVALGLAGGMVPSPSALVVLLGAIALHRAWFGVVLVAAYGLGMALTLTGLGVALARGSGSLRARMRDGRLGARALAFVPVGAAAVIVAAGALLAARGFAAA